MLLVSGNRARPLPRVHSKLRRVAGRRNAVAVADQRKSLAAAGQSAPNAAVTAARIGSCEVAGG
jgi:hypothetical protein